MGLVRRISGGDESPQGSEPSGVEAAPLDASTMPERRDPGPAGRHLRNHVRDRIVAELEAAKDASSVAEQIESLLDMIVREEGIVLTRAEHDRLLSEVEADIVGLGPIEPLVQDRTVSWLLVNGPDWIYAEQKGRLILADLTFDDGDHVRRVIDRLLDPVGVRLSESRPLWQGWLPGHHRVVAAIPPVAPHGPLLGIWKHSGLSMDAEGFLRFGSMTHEMLDLLRACVVGQLNILITGPADAGKTTLLNLLCSFLSADDFIVYVAASGAPELSRGLDRVTMLSERPADLHGVGGTPLIEVLRCATAITIPTDRLVLESGRGPTAYEACHALIGVERPWFATLEAATPGEALSRLRALAAEADADAGSDRYIRRIARSVDVVVHVERLADGTRKVISISDVEYERGRLAVRDICSFVEHEQSGSRRMDGGFVATGRKPPWLGHLTDARIPVPNAIFEPQG